MDKLFRKYEMVVVGNDGRKYEFKLPYSIEFTVQRNNLSTPNTASITIYNLGANTRAAMRKDMIDFDVTRTVSLAVGYGAERLTTIFYGTITECHSVRRGVDYITTITAQDANLIYTANDISITYGDGEALQSILNKALAQILPFGFTLGYSVPLEGTMPRGSTITGKAVNVLAQLLKKNVYIDGLKLFVLDDISTTFKGPVDKISAKNGLIGTPIIEQTFLRCDIIMEPRILVGQQIELESITGANTEMDANKNYKFDQNIGNWGITQFNGTYRVTGLSHSGTISPVVAGTAITNLQLANQAAVDAYQGVQ